MAIKSVLEEIKSILGARTLNSSGKNIPCEGIQFDSRNIQGGEIFIALKGKTTHGHNFLANADSRGAAVFIIEDEKAATFVKEQERVLIVDDSLAAFKALALWWRKRLDLPTIAVTGSLGKTTCKELIARLLLEIGPGNYSKNSFNNLTGVCYSILQASSSHQWQALEVGMNHAGEISELTKLIIPDLAVITTIAPVHIEHLGSLANICKAKMEIFESMSDKGIAVLNADNDLLRSQGAEKFSGGIKWFAAKDSHPEADYTLSNIVDLGLEGVVFNLEIDGGQQIEALKLNIPGAHHAYNALAAVAAVRSLFPRITTLQIRQAIERFVPPNMRMNLHYLTEGRLLIDDSYNANPVSMQGMLNVATTLKKEGRRLSFILGEMRELGEGGVAYHRQIGDSLAALDPAWVIGVGPLAEEYGRSMEKHKFTLEPSAQAAAQSALQKEFDCLIIKGSRGIKLEDAVMIICTNVQPEANQGKDPR